MNTNPDLHPLFIFSMIIILLVLLIVIPLLIIWSLNTLFSLAIPYTFNTWAAVTMLGLFLTWTR